MSAPVVSGTVALMLQANPSLTPNAVKAILQYTAEAYPGYDPLTEGAGFLNAKGRDRAGAASRSAVDRGVSRRLAVEREPDLGQSARQRRPPHVLPRTRGAPSVTWGATNAPTVTVVSWGVRCTTPDCTSARQARGGSTRPAPSNVVWGSICGGERLRR